MMASDSLDARAKAMRSVFEQTRSTLPQQSRQSCAGKQGQEGWNTPVGPQVMNAIFDRAFACTRQEESCIPNGGAEDPSSPRRSHPRPKTPRRDVQLSDERHAHVINELMKAHQMFQ